MSLARDILRLIGITIYIPWISNHVSPDSFLTSLGLSHKAALSQGPGVAATEAVFKFNPVAAGAIVIMPVGDMIVIAQCCLLPACGPIPSTVTSVTTSTEAY